MHIQIIRESVCLADDMHGQMEMFAEVEPNSSIQDLINTIENAGFLQYSSSHTSFVGFAGGIPIVRTYSPYHSKIKTEYLLAEHTSVAEAIKNGQLYFRL